MTYKPDNELHVGKRTSRLNATTETKGITKTKLMLAIYAICAIMLAVFALSIVPPNPIDYSLSDALGNEFAGTVDALNGDFIDTVTITFKSGAKYSGRLGDEGFNGMGEYIGADASWSISGEFTSGYLFGLGRYRDNLGAYDGQFSHSLPHGQGTYSSNQGWRYEGEFDNGNISGKGTIYMSDGAELHGIFQYGILVEQLFE